MVEKPLDLLDHLELERRLAARPPDLWPAHPGYHAFTYGWLTAGLARSITGLGMADLVRSELAEPLGTNGLAVGLPVVGLTRFAPPVDRIPPVRRPPRIVAEMSARYMPVFRRIAVTRRFLETLYVPGFDELFVGASPLVLHTQMPAVNGVVSADGLAKLYAPIANRGEFAGAQFLSPSTVSAISRVQNRAHDAVIGMRMNWRMGYHRAGAEGYRGDTAFGHYGFGGSGGWADPVTGLSFGFVTNDLRLIQAPVGGDRRIFHLSGLVLRLGRRLAGHAASAPRP